MRINLNEIKEGGYLEAGTYQCFIIDVVDREINDKKAFDIVLRDQVSGGTVRDTFFMTEKAEYRIKQLAITAGITEQEYQGFDTADLRGKEICIQVIKETASNGKLYSRVKSFWAPKQSNNRQIPEALPEKQISDDSMEPPFVQQKGYDPF
jgi:hypothetical protein